MASCEYWGTRGAQLVVAQDTVAGFVVFASKTGTEGHIQPTETRRCGYSYVQPLIKDDLARADGAE